MKQIALVLKVISQLVHYTLCKHCVCVCLIHLDMKSSETQTERSTYMHPRHDEGIRAAGVLGWEVVTVYLVPSELEAKRKQSKDIQ